MIPDFKAILSIDSSRNTADIAYEAVDNKPEYFKIIWELALTEKSPLNWRAARVLYFCVENNPDIFKNLCNETVRLFPEFSNDGLLRGFSYALSFMSPHLTEESIEILVQNGFERLLGNEKTAVKYNITKMLFGLCKRVPEIAGELQAAVEFNISEGIFRNNGEIKKILQKISS